MAAKSFSRGHATIYIGGAWVYCDNGEPVDTNRPCAKCGKLPTPEGYDACVGFVPGAKSACCGHGVEKGYVKWHQA